MFVSLLDAADDKSSLSTRITGCTAVFFSQSQVFLGSYNAKTVIPLRRQDSALESFQSCKDWLM